MSLWWRCECDEEYQYHAAMEVGGHSYINIIKSCHLFYFINTLCLVWIVCLYYGSSFAHKRVCTKLCTTNRLLFIIIFFYGGHNLISRTTPSWFKYLLIWKSSLFNDNVTTNYYYLWHPNSMWGVKNIVKKMKKDFECFYKLNKQRSWFVRALLKLLRTHLNGNEEI